MENKHVGLLVCGLAIIMIIIIFLFNNAMKNIIAQGCPLDHGGTSCLAYQTINQQTYLSLSLVGIVIIVGFFLIFTKQQEKIIVRTKTVKKKEPEKKRDLHDLKPEEKKVLQIIMDEKAIFQSALIEKTAIGKAKMTRIIDRLEGKGFVERKRRGMTNVVVLK